MYVHHVHACSLEEPKNIVRSPSTGITKSCELWMMEMNELQEKGLWETRVVICFPAFI